MAELMRYVLLDSVQSWSAFAVYLLAIVVLFGVRTWQQIRTTGSSGFNGFRGRGAAARLAGIAFVVAMLTGFLSPLLSALHVLEIIWTSPPRLLGVGFLVGALVAVDGVVLAARAQKTMGASWRIGVDASERTELVTHGVFARIRNPIFTALILIQAGTALMYPTALSLVGVSAMILACELQVRLVEEPYLRKTHPVSYPVFTLRTGRFVPPFWRSKAGSIESRP